MNNLKELTRSGKENYLIDVKGYSKDDFILMNEMELDDIIMDNNYIDECLSFNNEDFKVYNLSKKYIIIYNNGNIFESDNEEISITKLDGDDSILKAFIKLDNKYTEVLF